MSREEFLKILKESLSMSLEKDAINEQLDYYDKYISDEINKGRSEKEVIDELGDPRLIAKTIKTVSGASESLDENESKNSYNNTADDTTNKSYNRYGESKSGYGQDRGNYNSYVGQTGTFGCVIFGLIVFIIVMGILRFMGSLALGVGELALSGPIGFLIVTALFYLLFGRGRR